MSDKTRKKGGRGGKGGDDDGGTLHEADVADAPSDEARGPVRFQPQEVEFLDPREGHPMPASQVQEKLVEMRTRKRRHGAARGLYEHDMGTDMRELYGGQAEVVKGHPSFAVFGKVELGLDRRRTWDFLRVATYATEVQAEAYGIERLRLALSIREKLGTPSLTALEKVDLTTELGEVVRTPATVPELESVLARLDAAAQPSVPRALKRSVVDANEALVEERANERPLARVRMAFVAHQGKPKLKVTTPLDEEQLVALQRVVARLQRRGVLKAR